MIDVGRGGDCVQNWMRIDLSRVRRGWVALKRRMPSPVRTWAEVKHRFGSLSRKQRLMVTAAAFLLIVVVTGGICLANITEVTVAADGRVIKVHFWGGQVDQALKAAEIELGPNDETIPSVGTRVKAGARLQVVRAVGILVVADGKSTPVSTIPLPPQKVLAKLGIRVGPNDRVSPGGDQPVKVGEKIQVVRVVTREVTQQYRIARQVQKRPDSSMNKGQTKVIEAGEDGVKQQTLRLVYEDGVLKKRVVLADRLLKAPQDRVVAIGVHTPIYSLVTSRGTYYYSHMLVMSSTAYYPGPESCGKNATGYTFTGIKAGYGVVAVDPRVIPLGSKLYIEGYGPAIAADTGSAVKGKIIDLCFETYREAYLYGRKPVKVYILARP